MAETVDAAEAVFGQAARCRKSANCHRAVNKKNGHGAGALEIGERAVWQYCRNCLASFDAKAIFSDAAGTGKVQNVTGR